MKCAQNITTEKTIIVISFLTVRAAMNALS